MVAKSTSLPKRMVGYLQVKPLGLGPDDRRFGAS